MDNPITRKREMDWLQSIGVKGIKVDFFGGDKQETMRLWHEDILSDADDHGLMVIFHGCTLPRGWERMYPNYVGSEAVLASENMVFNQHFCDKEAENATLHPFYKKHGRCNGIWRNLPEQETAQDKCRRQLSAHVRCFSACSCHNIPESRPELLALTPNNLEDASPLALEYMRSVPTKWDETRYVAGYPGQYAVIARKKRREMVCGRYKRQKRACVIGTQS